MGESFYRSELATAGGCHEKMSPYSILQDLKLLYE